MKKMNNKGFSLVELIIVIAIMAILIGVLAPQYIKYVEKSRKSADLDTLDSVYTACSIAASDAEVTNSPTTTKTISWTANNEKDWGYAVKEALGCSVSDLQVKSKSGKDGNTSGAITVKLTNDKNGFIVEAGKLTVTAGARKN